MTDHKQKRTRGVPWADHTPPSSEGEANPADRSARIDPEELDDVEVSPGKVAASTNATPDTAESGGRAHVPSADERADAPSGQRDVGKGSLRVEHQREEHKTD